MSRCDFIHQKQGNCPLIIIKLTTGFQGISSAEYNKTPNKTKNVPIPAKLASLCEYLKEWLINQNGIKAIFRLLYKGVNTQHYKNDNRSQPETYLISIKYKTKVGDRKTWAIHQLQFSSVSYR